MKKRRNLIIVVVSLIVVIGIGIAFAFFHHQSVEQKRKEQEEKRLIQKMEAVYHPLVKTTKEGKVYQKNREKYQEVGTLLEGVTLKLDTKEKIIASTKYFKILDQDYYVSYQDLAKVEQEEKKESFSQYIPFAEDVVVPKGTVLKQNGREIFSWNEELRGPLIVRGEEYTLKLGDEYYQVAKDAVTLTEGTKVEQELASAIATLNYHFFYEEGVDFCNQTICLSTKRFQEHLNYFRDHGFYTMRMIDMERFVNEEVQLPKNSVLITIDDGWLVEKGAALLNEYQMHGTLFSITSYYGDAFSSDYVEVHSHGHDLHNNGVCPGGQGGGIKCLPKETLLNDLKTSKEILHGSSYFCYPFYEYNDYAIEVLKEAGYRMAFIGGNRKVRPGMNPMLLPRYPIVSDMAASDIAQIVS